jgi:hypothetical protein
MRKSDLTLLGTQLWSSVKIGGLGYVTGIDWSGLYCRTDVGGAYGRADTDSPWQQLITSDRMTIPAPASLSGLGTDYGCFAVASSKADVTVVQLAFRGRMLRSTNSGATFTDDSLNGTTGLYMNANGGAQRLRQHKLEGDPTNSAIFYFGAQRDGLWQRLSGTWTHRTDVPSPTIPSDDDKAVLIAIDNTSSLVGSGAASRRSIVYASSSGNGLYKSTDGGATFTRITNGSTFTASASVSCTTTNGSAAVTTASTSGYFPGIAITGTGIPAGATILSVDSSTQFTMSANATATGTNNLSFYVFKLKHLMCDSAGLLWLAVDDGSQHNVWTYNGTTFSQNTVVGASGKNIASIEQDPKNSSRFVGIAGGGDPWQSTDSCATWKFWNGGSVQRAVARSLPIVASVMNANFTNGGQSASASTIVPHSSLTKDFAAMGLGVCYFDTWPASNATIINWNEDAAGIEELVANNILITPNGNTIVASQDKSAIRIPSSGYAANSYPPGVLDIGFGLDYAADNHDWIAVGSNFNLGGPTSGYSTDGGLNFTAFAQQPAGNCGSLAVGNAGQIAYFPGQNYWPQASSNSGASWTYAVFAGFNQLSNGVQNGWGNNASDARRHIVCADKDHPGTFYAYNYGSPNDGASKANSRGLWKSTDGGFNYTRVNSTTITAAIYATTYHARLLIDRGILYLTQGETGSAWDGDTGSISYRSEDGGLSWTALGQLYEINLLAIGAPAPGSANHTLYALGWKSGVFGLYRSLDKGATWTLLANNPSFDHAYAMAADPTVFGRIVTGYTGTGFAESNYSYTLLLKAA